MSNKFDNRFDRLFVLKIEEGDIPKLKQLCEDYGICDNESFEGAASFHRIWGIGPAGLVYLSYSMVQKGFDFNSLAELEKYLDSFEIKN